MHTPINSGVVADHGEHDVTTGWQECDAGHRYKPGYPCAICGATGDQPCNGGQYVLPKLRKPLRTEAEARADLNRTPLQQDYAAKAGRLRALATATMNDAAIATEEGDPDTAQLLMDDALAMQAGADALMMRGRKC